LISHIAGDLKRDGYYMQFDADDILHPKFVEHVLADNNGRGYLIDTVYVDFRTHKTYTKFLSQHRSHTQIAAYCTLYERPLSAVPFKATLYLTAHGENMYGRRGLLSDRTKTLVEVAPSEDDAKATLKEFGVSWVDLV
jgi:hypothetical protein